MYISSFTPTYLLSPLLALILANEATLFKFRNTLKVLFSIYCLLPPAAGCQVTFTHDHNPCHITVPTRTMVACLNVTEPYLSPLPYSVSCDQFLCATAGTAIARLSHRNSVCLSVRPSVTRVDQAKTAQARIIKSSPSAAPKTLVSGSVTLSQKFHRGHPNRGP